MKRIVYTLLLSFVFSSIFAHRVWIVSTTNPVTSAAGTGRANKGDLKYCIEQYASGDVITFATELAGQTIFFENGLLLKTNASLTIDASNLSENVIFDGSFKTASPKRINILIDGSQGYGTNYFTIRGVTFQNICVVDYLSTTMGALFVNHGTVVIENCIFRDNIFYANTATSGSSIQGAIINTASGRTSLTIRACKFINNFGRRGAAITIWPFNEALIDACYFDNNSTYAGGACVFINSTGTNTGGESYTEIRNSTMTRNKGNATGTLVSNQGLAINSYLRIINSTITGNVSTSLSTQQAMVNVVGRRLEVGGTLFGNNLNQNGVAVNDFALGNDASTTLPQDSLVLLGYNILSTNKIFDSTLSEVKLGSSPSNTLYEEWGTKPLISPVHEASGTMIPTEDLEIQNALLRVIPRVIMENWMFAPAYDQRLYRRDNQWNTIGAFEINGAGDGSSVSNVSDFSAVKKKVIVLEKGNYIQLIGFENIPCEIGIYNMLGQKIKSSYQPPLAPLAIPELPDGNYIVTAMKSSFVFSK